MKKSQKKRRRKLKKVGKKKEAGQQKLISQFLLPLDPKKQRQKNQPQVKQLLQKRKRKSLKDFKSKGFHSDGELYFTSDKRRHQKIDFQIKPYYRKCTKFFTKFDRKFNKEDYILMNRSFRLYLQGEKLKLETMSLKQVKQYLLRKAEMIEQPQQKMIQKRECQKHIKYKEYQFQKMFSDKKRYSRGQIENQINMSKKRIKKNGSIVPRKRGKRRQITQEMIEFLKAWLGKNVGKTFKYAYEALITKFGQDQVKISQHGCYKAFRRYTNFTYKRIQRVKIKSNTNTNKQKRIEYLQRFLPYHMLEAAGELEIIFIDEAGFNLDKQGCSYAWGEKGQQAVKEVPIKIQNTTLVAGITNKGYMCYQIFNKGIKGQDFLGFMSNLTQCFRQKKGIKEDVKMKQMKEGQALYKMIGTQQSEWFINKSIGKDYVYVMDNAKQHISKAVKLALLQYCNVQFLAPYTPHLNVNISKFNNCLQIIEIFFGELKRRVARKLYSDQDELVKGISDALQDFDRIYFQKIYQRLIWQMIYVVNGEDLE